GGSRAVQLRARQPAHARDDTRCLPLRGAGRPPGHARPMKAAVMDSAVGVADDDETFRLAKRLGFAGVEVVAVRDDLRSSDRLESLRRASAATVMAVPSLVLGEHS